MYIYPTETGYTAILKRHNGESILHGKNRMDLIECLLATLILEK